jgi:hypothetical protein
MKRRFFLQGFGGAALAAPFLSSLVGRGAFAQTDGLPLNRFILFFMHNGMNTTRFFLEKEDGPLTVADLSPTLQPLGDLVDQLLIPRGFKSLNAYGAGQLKDPHNQAMGSKLTCAKIDEGGNAYAQGMSVDHEMAKQMNHDASPPMLLSVGQSSTSIKEVVSFSAANQAYVSEVNPTAVYSKLTNIFGTAVPGGTPGTPAPGSPADYKVLAGQSSLDLVRDDLTRLAGKNMSAADKARIQAWADLLRDTETGMADMGSQMDAIVNASCTADFAAGLGVDDASVAAAGTGASGSKSGSFNFNIPSANDESMKLSFTKGGDMMLNLITLSAICDYNRVMGMVYPGYVIFNWDNISHQYDHHGISHRDGTLDVDNQCVPGVMKMIEEIDNWYIGKYAKLCGMLKSIPEGDANILHNSATMFLNELSDGDAHNLNDLPVIIAGSAGGKLKNGVAVNVEGRNIGAGASETGCTDAQNTSGRTSTNGGNVPINKLYCTLMNAFGMTDGGSPWEKWGAGDTDKLDGTFQSPGEVAELKA